ncbi:MAG: hypothetical protein JSW69_02810, partial [Deltaproteobacteria bacterium]
MCKKLKRDIRRLMSRFLGSITLEGGYIDQKPLLEAGDSNLLIIEFVDPAASSSVPHTNCIAELTLPCIF